MHIYYYYLCKSKIKFMLILSTTINVRELYWFFQVRVTLHYTAQQHSHIHINNKLQLISVQTYNCAITNVCKEAKHIIVPSTYLSPIYSTIHMNYNYKCMLYYFVFHLLLLFDELWSNEMIIKDKNTHIVKCSKRL